MAKKNTCPECGSKQRSGKLPVEIDVAGVKVTDGSVVGPICEQGHYTLSQSELEESERRAALAALTSINGPSGAVLRFARKSIGLRQTDLAVALGAAPETVCRWESNTHIDRQVSLAMAQLLTMYDEQPEQFDLIVRAEQPPLRTEPITVHVVPRRRHSA